MNIEFPSHIGDYQIKEVIGKGTFSTVALAYSPSTRQHFACKIIPRDRMKEYNQQNRLESEIRILQQIHHRNVVGMHDMLKDEQNYYLFLEYCGGGELFKYIVSRGRLDEYEAAHVISQILNTVHFLHNIRITHRDLKPENILFDNDGNIKITDFGLSRFTGSDHMVNTPCGSPCYVSPECISGKSYNAVSSDMWSIGVIFFAMVTGHLPWTKRNQAQLFEQIRKGDYRIPSYLPSECKSFIEGLLNIDSERRLSYEGAINHPFLIHHKFIANPPKYEKILLPQPSLRKVDEFFELDSPEDSINFDAFDRKYSCVYDDIQLKRILDPKKIRIRKNQSPIVNVLDILQPEIPVISLPQLVY